MEQSTPKRSLSEVITDKNIVEQIFLAEKLMSYYRCAMYEVETKFRVLNENFFIQNERNPSTVRTDS